MTTSRRFLGVLGVVAFVLGFAMAVPCHAGLLITPNAGYSITWNGNDGNYFTTANPAVVPTNIALQPNVTAFGGNALGGVHAIPNVRDARYGNNWSWIGNGSGYTPNDAIGLNLSTLRPISAVAWGRDNGNSTAADACGGQCNDRWPGVYEIQFTTDPSPASAGAVWNSVGTVNYQSADDTVVGGAFTPWFRHQYEIRQNGQPIRATGIRLRAPLGTAIDEIEAYYNSPAVPTNGLKTWLKADAGAVADAGNLVSVWGDQSGAGNNATQATAANQPALAANVWTGMPVVRFDGSNDYLTLPTSSALGIQNSDYELFVVARSSSGNTQFLVGGAITEYELHLNGSTQGARFIPNSPWSTQATDIGTNLQYTNGRFHVFDPRVDGGTSYFRVDGIQSLDTATNARSAVDAALRLGIRSDNGYPLAGDIAEVILYNRALTPQERNQVTAYLQDRWAWNSFHLTETGGDLALANVATSGTAFAKDALTGYAAHAIAHLNDGIYGNSNSWIGATVNSFAGVGLDSPTDINFIAFGRDNGGEAQQLVDRYQGTYTLQYTRVLNPDASTPDVDWQTIGMFDYNGTATDSTGYLRHLYSFDRILGVTGVRILVNSPSLASAIAIDELEFGNVPEPGTMVLALLGIGLVALVRRRATRSRHAN